ncbi:hypothetical protein Tco_1116462 [Tanacetum coccineum]
MSSGLSAGMAEVAAMSESAFRKRFRSSYESSPSMSPPDLPSWKRYRGTSELVEYSDDEEDEEIEESMGSDSMSEDAEDEGPTAEDEDLAAKDEGLTTRVEGPKDEEEAVPGGQQQAALVIGTTVSAPLGLGYGALRRRELALEEGDVYSTFEFRQGSGPAPESEIPERVLAFRQPTLTTWTDSEDGMNYIDIPDYPPPAPPELSPALFKRYDRNIRELFTRSRAVRKEIFSQRYRFRSLEYEQERVAVTFGAIWRPLLALEAWAGQTDTQRAAMWHAISCSERTRIYGYSLLRRDVHN